MSEPYERLDRAMNARRLDLRMNWRELSEAAGISYEALRGIRRGDYRPSELTARALDEALRWERGGVEAILAGGDATPMDVSATRQDREARSARLHRELNEEREKLRELTERLENGDLALAAAYLQGLIDRSAG